MIGQVSQVTLNPISETTSEIGLFEIPANSDEMFMPVISTSNIVVNDNVLLNPTSIAANTGANI